MSGERGPRGDRGEVGVQGVQGEAGKLPVFIAVGLILATLALTGLSLAQTRSVNTFTEELRASSVALCEHQNDVRGVLRTFLLNDAKATSRLPDSFFPDIPPGEFDVFQHRKMERTERAVVTLADIDCAAEFADGDTGPLE